MHVEVLVEVRGDAEYRDAVGQGLGRGRAAAVADDQGRARGGGIAGQVVGAEDIVCGGYAGCAGAGDDQLKTGALQGVDQPGKQRAVSRTA